MIKVIIVDDHVLFRQGLKLAFKYESIDISVVGEAGSGAELFSLLKTTFADTVLLDINLPDISGDKIARRLRSEYPDMKILAISAENAEETILSMIDSGIDGFISKQYSNNTMLIEAVRSVTSGIEYFGRDISSIMMDVYVSKKKTSAITDEFTGRERDIIQLSGEGLIVKEIADRLEISINTVLTYKKKIYQKLGINNQVEMVQYALKKGIIRIQ